MKTIHITISIDEANGVMQIPLRGSNNIHKTISLLDEGCEFLANSGKDIVIDFDENGKAIGLELLGF